MLRAKCDEAANGGVVAALDVGAEELAALGEAEGVDRRSSREDRVRGNVGAGLVDMVGHVSNEGGVPIAGGVFVHANRVDERSRVDFLGELGDAPDAVGLVGIAQAWQRRSQQLFIPPNRSTRRKLTMPNDQRQRGVIVVAIVISWLDWLCDRCGNQRPNNEQLQLTKNRHFQ